MASPLLLCTTDILRLVFQLLPRDALHTVCFVNNDLRTLAEPFLYSSVKWKWLNIKSPTPPVNSLLQSILRRPELAAYIQALIIDGDKLFSSFYVRGGAPKISVTKDELDEPIRLVERLKVPYGNDWIRGLCQGTPIAFITLLVSQLPNLKCLHLGRLFTYRSQLLGMMFMSSASGPDSLHHRLPNFEHLRDVSLLHFEPEIDSRLRARDVINTEHFLPVFYLPSVQHISVSIDNPLTFAWPVPYPPDPVQLTSLELFLIREGHLGKLLSATRSVKNLHWDWFYRDDLEDNLFTPVINLDQITADLSHIRDTLTDLTITASTDVSRAAPAMPPIDTRGSLKGIVDFDALKKLEVPVPFLVGFSIDPLVQLADVLPKNIQFLTITDDLFDQEEYEWRDVDIMGIIETWFRDWKTSTPNLQGLRVFLKELDDEWGPTKRQKLRELCAEAGVQVEITKLCKDLEP